LAFLAGLLVSPFPAYGQSYDDPRLAEWGATLNGIEGSKHQILELRAKLCAGGLAEYCKPMAFANPPSVEQMRAMMAQQKK
jgi:hypothetical protein